MITGIECEAERNVALICGMIIGMLFAISVIVFNHKHIFGDKKDE